MQTTLIETLKKELVGKKLRHRNQHGRTVVFEIENVSSSSWSHDLEPSTAANDWWPKSESGTNNYIHFVDGSKVEFSINEKLDIID